MLSTKTRFNDKGRRFSWHTFRNINKYGITSYPVSCKRNLHSKKNV